MNATEAAAAKAASAGVVQRQPMASGGGLGVGGILQKSAAQVIEMYNRSNLHKKL